MGANLTPPAPAGSLTIGALLAQGIQRLREAPASDQTTLHLDAELLLACALSMNRAQLRTHPETVPSEERARAFAGLIERRAAGEPVAYILGYRDFWTLRLGVNPSVLVPRPETELLVERALAVGAQGPARVVDLGTGSGAIALALAAERPQWLITATDISAAALATARANATMLNLERLEFVSGSWFEPLAGRQFDLIVSNPPYVAQNDPALLSATLQREPSIALTAAPDGLACLRHIAHFASQYLERRGWLLLEHGPDQADAVARELVVRGFRHVRSIRDLAGKLRVTEAQWG
jgi:release factor glutamine methyltransferase